MFMLCGETVRKWWAALRRGTEYERTRVGNVASGVALRVFDSENGVERRESPN